MMRVVASWVLLLRSDFARVVLSGVTIETLTGVGKVGAHLGCAVLTHLLLMTAVVLGGKRRGRVRALVEVV